ncbi:hypothetical protein [Nocardia sp. NPDC003963]
MNAQIGVLFVLITIGSRPTLRVETADKRRRPAFERRIRLQEPQE